MTDLFQSISVAPTDPILGLNDLFKKDTNPKKLNLGIGVCMDDNGNVPIMTAVKKAEAHLLETQSTKTYVSMLGAPDFIKETNTLLYGDTFQAETTVTAQMPAGSGALRVGFEFVKSCLGAAPVYVSDVTWGNHRGIIGKTGLECRDYRYYDAETQSVNFDGMMEDLRAIQGPAVILLHTVCHNPTGVDLSKEQWQTLSELFKKNDQLVPFMDCAYQGFAQSLEEDIYALRLFTEANLSFIQCYSYSKNMALYRERIGALSIRTSNPEKTEAISTQVQSIVRGIYSSPPAHGGEIVSTILGSKDLRAEWEAELNQMRERAKGIRAELASRRPELAFLTQQNGLFSMIGLSKETIDQLRTEFGIYIVGNSRINIAGFNPAGLAYFCEALDQVS